jgi:hypothetical protein
VSLGGRCGGIEWGGTETYVWRGFKRLRRISASDDGGEPSRELEISDEGRKRVGNADEQPGREDGNAI